MNVAIPKPVVHVPRPAINVAVPHVPKPHIATPRPPAIAVAKPDLVKPAPAANLPSTPKFDAPKVATPGALPKSEQRNGAIPTDFAPGNATTAKDFTPQFVPGGGLKTERTPPPGGPPKATGAPTAALPITSTEQLNAVPPMSSTRPPVATLPAAPIPADPKSAGNISTPPPITSTEQLSVVPPRTGTAIVEGGGSRKSGEVPKPGSTAVVEGTAKNGTALNGASPAVVDGKSAKPGAPNTTTAIKDGKPGSPANGSVAKLPEAISERNAGKANASKSMQPATAAVVEGNSGPTVAAQNSDKKAANYKAQSTNQSWVDAGYSTPDNGAVLMTKSAPSNFTYNYNNGSYTWHYFMQNGVMVTYATQNGSNTVVVPVGISTYQPPNTAYKAGMQMSDLGPVTLPTNSVSTPLNNVAATSPNLSSPGPGTTNTWQPGQSIAHSPDIGLDSTTPVQNTGASTVGNTISNMIQSATVGPSAGAEPLNQPHAQPPGQSPKADNSQPQPTADSGTRGSPLTDDQKQMLKGMDTSNMSPDAQKQFQKLMGATDPTQSQGSTGGASSSSSNDPNMDPSKQKASLDDGLNKIGQKYSDMKQQQDQADANAAADDRRQKLNSACPSGGCQGTTDPSTPQRDWSDQGVMKMKEDLAKNTTEVSKNSDNPVNAYVDPKSGGVAAQDSSGKRYWLVPPDPKGR
ncbi:MULTISPECIES: hypothetical protein [unclassified Bradyrhizobium]